MTNTSRRTRLTSGGMKQRLVVGLATLFVACCLLASPAGAGGGHNDAVAPALPDNAQPQNAVAGPDVEIRIDGVKVVVPDLVLRDQEGRRVRFYSDLIKDKVVVLSFFYTSCEFVCTMQGAAFSKLQTLLSERLGKSVHLISVTTDPKTDTPQQLKAWGTRYHAKPGWTLVTGEVAEMNKLLKQFTGNPTGKGMHAPVTFIGNDRRGVWIGAGGVSAPEQLLDLVVAIAQEGDDTAK